MKYGTGIALLVIGAILSFAIRDSISGIDLVLIGYILMGAGVLGLIIAALSGTKGRVRETRTLNDPATGESITKSTSKDI